MLVKIFSIYDSKAQAYLQPFFSPTKGTAIRAFADHVNNPDTDMCKHAEDFTLFEIGEFNDSNAEITLLSTPASLGLAIEHKKQ